MLSNGVLPKFKSKICFWKGKNGGVSGKIMFYKGIDNKKKM